MITITEIHERILRGETTAREEIQAALDRAEQASGYHALLSVTPDRALEMADEVDLRIKNGEEVGPLAGVPFVVKDNYLAFGAPTTAASHMLQDFMAPLQATVVEKLEQAGAICIGKSNLDAFAHGGSTENSAFGVTNNAHDMTKVAGGSSGGSAVITALGVVPFALGTDTGGSIRQPASFNGVYGYKPTYGMASRYGAVAMASSTDTMGCFANTAADTELVMSIMAGKDSKDHTTLDDYYVSADLPAAIKVGVIRDAMTDDVDPDVLKNINAFADKLRSAGHVVEEVDLPMSRYALAMYYIIVPAGSRRHKSRLKARSYQV
jgi:aspartyl-tRNA(Asn)/glutamyl-tRNA(Gln) amidotransferase subunit A